MLGVSKDFGAKKGKNMVYDDIPRFVGEVGIVDAQTGIKPIDFILHELPRHETLASRLN